MREIRAVAEWQALGRYDLLEKVGVGGMCEVYRARHRDTGQVVAVKILPARTARNETLVRRFEQEFRVASRLEHPNIVRALDFCLGPPTPFLVMEFVGGPSLGEKVERDGRLAEDIAIGLIVQVCEGLEHAHSQGVVHRDIKPDNLLLTRAGEVKITDFGLVKELLIDRDLTRTGRGLGTPHFMAPEQFRNAKTADTRADIYSLGATLYTLLTGTLPFAGSSPLEAWMRKVETRLVAPRSLVPTLSLRTEATVLRAMDADPERRQSSCAAFAQELLRGRASASADAGQVWHLVYENREGDQYVLRQPLEQIRQYLSAGFFENAVSVRASRSENGPFDPLHLLPEFQDLVRPPAVAPAEQPALLPAIEAPVRSSTSAAVLLLSVLAGVVALAGAFFISR